MNLDARAPYGRGVPGNRWDLLDGEELREPPLVSVIVVHFEQPAELARTLAALERQTHPRHRLEVIVVDDASAVAPNVPAGIHLIVQPEPGFHLSAARNLGARAATGSVLCFLDADTAPEPDYVRRLTRLPALLPEAVTVGTRQHAALARLPLDAPVEIAGPAAELPAPRWLEEAYAASRDLLDADDRSYRHVIGAVAACSRWFFEQRVGGFDESFTAYGGEDWEWAQRAWLAGAVLAHVPDAVAWHDGADWAGRSSDADASARQAQKNASARQVQKNGETLLLADLIPVAGSRGLAVRSARADVLVVLGGATDVADSAPPFTSSSPVSSSSASTPAISSVASSAAASAPFSVAAAYLCVDSVLRALPAATVVVSDALAAVFAADARVLAASSAGDAIQHCRVRIDVPLPVRIRPAAAPLIARIDRLGVGDAGAIVVTNPDGELLLRAESSRSRARAAAWPGEEFFTTCTEATDVVERIDGEPSLAAYLGGWG